MKKCKKMTNMKCNPTLSMHQMLDLLVVFASSEERKSGRFFHSDGRGSTTERATDMMFYVENNIGQSQYMMPSSTSVLIKQHKGIKRTHVRFEGRAGCQPLRKRMLAIRNVLVASH